MDTRFSELPVAIPATDADLYPVVQAGVTRKQTLAQQRTALGANIATFAALNGVADRLAYFTGIGAQALTAFTATARALLAASSNAAARASIGVVNATPGYIDGLELVWGSANSLSVNPGAAYVSSLGDVLTVGTAISKGSLTLTAATWYHVYLYLNGATPDLEIVTTAPSVKYFGNARTKTGDTSRRYLGSVRTGAANTIFRFVQSSGMVRWQADLNSSPFLVLSLGQAVAATVFSCAAVVPSTAVTALVQVLTALNGSTTLYVANPDTGTVSATFSQLTVLGNCTLCADLAVSAAQTLSYLFSASPGSGGVYARISGYLFER